MSLGKFLSRSREKGTKSNLQGAGGGGGVGGGGGGWWWGGGNGRMNKISRGKRNARRAAGEKRRFPGGDDSEKGLLERENNEEVK